MSSLAKEEAEQTKGSGLTWERIEAARRSVSTARARSRRAS